MKIHTSRLEKVKDKIQVKAKGISGDNWTKAKKYNCYDFPK